MAEVTDKSLKEFQEWLDKKNGRSKKSKTPAKRAARSRKKAETSATGKNTTKEPRRRVRRRKPGFSQEIREAAHSRAGDRCENPLCGRNVIELGGEHHCIPRSQYHKSDRNDLWNCAVICEECHKRVTSPRTPEDKRLRRYFERCAYARKNYDEDTLGRELHALEQALRDNTLDMVRSFELLSKTS